MLSRKSRKIRTSEPILHDIPQNNILIELTTPLKDGTIPLVNFLENTERFLGDNANMITRVYELEREITRYKSVFRRYDEYLDKMSQVTNKSVETEEVCKNDEQPGNVRTIRDYFKPIHQNQKRIEETVSNVVTRVESNSKPEPLSQRGFLSNHKIEIDHQLKENVKEMEGILSQMKNRKMEVGINKEFSKCTTKEISKEVIATTNAQPKQPVANAVNYKKIDNIRLSYDSSETKTMFTSSASIFGLIKQGDVLNIVHNDTVSAIPSDYLVVKKIHSSRLFETTAAATNIDSSAADSIASETPNLVVRQIIFRQSTEQVSAAM